MILQYLLIVFFLYKNILIALLFTQVANIYFLSDKIHLKISSKSASVAQLGYIYRKTIVYQALQSALMIRN